MSPPQYLTGDKAGIDAFLDRFDVFLFDCDGRFPASLCSAVDKYAKGHRR